MEECHGNSRRLHEQPHSTLTSTCVSAVTVPPENLANTLDRIVETITSYCRLPHPSFAVVIAIWIALTFSFHLFRYCGYLVLWSLTPRSGKTRLLRLIGSLSNGNPKPLTMPTAATLYRTKHAVLLLDEVDHLKQQEGDVYGAVIAILNAGFEQDGTVPRTERRGETWEVVEYAVYGPKVFAGIEKLPDTLVDRAFRIEMARVPKRMPRLNMRRMAGEFEQIREQIKVWTQMHATDIAAAYDQLPSEVPSLVGFDDRYQDISEPLIVLASLADAERPDGPEILPRLIEGLHQAAVNRTLTLKEQQFTAFLALSNKLIGASEEVFVPSSSDLPERGKSLLQLCHEVPGLRDISSAKTLATLLHNFALSPRQSADGKYRGYWLCREWVEEWRSVYKFESGKSLSIEK